MVDPTFDFKTEADRLILVCNFLADIDLESLRLAVTRAHTIGPIVDPTRYRDALFDGSMDDIARLAARAEVLVSAFMEIKTARTEAR